MAATKECTTQVGVFATREAAERTVADLRAAGYRDDQIGLVYKDEKGHTTRTDGAGEGAAIGAATGAVAGAAVGAAVGAGVVAGVIPVIGPVFALGTLGTVLLNAAGGATVAGLAGALVGWGVAEDDAQYYENEVNAGRYLVTVECGRGGDARDVLGRYGGYSRATAVPPVM